MARFFIDRPVFAIVVALIITIAGVISLVNLPVAQYPHITLPVINVSSIYLGASPDVVEEAVAQPIEQQVNGVEGMIYMDSQCGGDGSYALQVTFALETDPDIATVLVQNRVSQAEGSLPSEVKSAGVVVTKQSPDTLMYISLYSPKGTYDDLWLNNYGTINIVDVIKRVKGVGNVQAFGSDFGMRIWLHPDKMARLGLTPTDVVHAVSEQNVQAPAGQIGQYPAPKGQAFQYTLRVQGRLVEPEEFQNIIVRSQPDGSFVRIRDIARVELAAQGYSFIGRMNGKPAAVLAVNLTPDASAVETSDLVRAELKRLAPRFPPDVEYSVFIDNTVFVKTSLAEVVKTFFEALLLVFIVVFLFLQTWRATLIPMLAVPVALVGTFASFILLGFSINTLTLLAMVLAIGIVVDDAIVVVEAVEHHMREYGLNAREATRKAMDDVSGPVVAIALVLCSVFVPVAFLGGIAGQLYKQFAVTVAVSTALSATIALSLTPALCALMMRPHDTSRRGLRSKLFGGFNAWFDRITERYGRAVRAALRRAAVMLLALVILSFATVPITKAVPTGFVPEEDQGYLFGCLTLPDAAALDRTIAAFDQLDKLLPGIAGVQGTLDIIGYDMLSGTNKPNTGLFVVAMKPWDDRKADEEQVGVIIQRIMAAASSISDAVAIVFPPPPIPGFSGTGFQFMVQDRGGGSPAELENVAGRLVAEAGKRPELSQVYSVFSNRTPSYQLEVDREKAKKLGVQVTDIFMSLQSLLGGYQINDFTRFGRTYKVIMQAEPQFRGDISALGFFYVRSERGNMVPLTTLLRPQPTSGPPNIERYNVYRTAQIGFRPSLGFSSGDAMKAMEQLAAEVLPATYGYEWAGMSRQEKESAGQAPVVFGLALVFVFLFLAALYESWSVPFAVLLAVPLGVFGAMSAQLLRGLQNNIYAQIGLILLVGLSAKNAILIVEFAKANREKGMSIPEAAAEAAKVRLRPILMTSLAFILGVVPLVIAAGAGAGARHALGTSVFGGMVAATGLAIFIVPVLFAAITKISERVGRQRVPASPPEYVGKGGDLR
ncbi:MAG: multidrug efflux RND transporter permease subunit [Acidobacteriota bacterium]